MEENRSRAYYIPANVFDGPSAFGIAARNWVEAVVLAVIPGGLFWHFANFSDLSIKIILMMILTIPPAAFALIGYNGESLTQFVKTYLNFRKNRLVLEYTIEDDEEAVQRRSPFFELENQISDLQEQIHNTKDKGQLKELKTQLKERKKELRSNQAELKKAEAEDAAQVKKEQEAKRKKETEHADSLAEKEIQRRREEGEKLSKKQIKAIYTEYREKYVLEMPSAPNGDDGIQRNISVQEYLPIDRIEDRCIVTKGGRFIRILAVAPINFPMLSAEQQNFTVDQFALLIRSCPVNIQIKTMAKSADVEGFIEKMQERIHNETDEKCITMMKDYINTLRSNATQNAVSRQFFLVLEYDESQSTRNTTDKDRKRILENAVTRAKQQLKRCNNMVYEFENEQDEVDFIYNIFFSQLERFNAYGMNYYDKVEYAYAQAAAYPNRGVQAVDFLSPINIDLTSSQYVVIDGVYYGYMYIPSSGYRSNVWGSWLFNAINAGGGIDVDIFFSRRERDKVRSAARRQINLSAAQMHDKNTNTDSFDALRSKAQSAQYIKDGLANGEDFFYITTIITVIAMDEETLFSRMAQITAMFEDMDMRCIPANYHQEDAFLGTLPLCKVPDSIFALGHRNMLTSGAAALYPFASYELMDDNGILFGTNVTNGSLVMPDLFDTAKYKSANMYILGSTGAGKTYNLGTQALRTRESGKQVFVIAPIKGHEFQRSCEAIGGQYIRMGPGSPHCINIMEIRKRDEEAVLLNRLLDGIDFEESILAEKISSLETLFEIMAPDITNEEEQLLNGHIVETYRKFGITDDNDSLYDPLNPGEYRQMPTLKDLFLQMENDSQMNRIRNIMSKYVTGSAKNFSEQTNVSLDNPYIVIDLTPLSKNKKMLPIGMYIALNFIWDKIKEDRTKNKRLFIDEIWNLMGKGAPPVAAQFVLEIFKTIRAFGGGAVACTQELEDFFALDGGAYGKAILNACTLGMIMKVEPVALKLIQENLDLEQREIDIIQGLERGQALIVGSGNSVAVKIVASKMEHDLLTTSAADLTSIFTEKLQEKKVPEKEALTPGEQLSAVRRERPQRIPVGHKKVKL
ncbi:hypothetical protein [Anaerotruncus colihominis]|uniref:TraG P-loop domain-containing protein n=1 Tax=Anaerotruncus colihominis TaxID=169435 RepID=A0A845SQA0_9FIRM|nr:hypothetical protein [Anaerotruncus colihominis]NDO37785.1 hypothetical protein [Anaerotruncus colihominis]